jgi:hypothetical protein
VAEADRVLAELEDLIRRINRTNAAAMLDEQMTITDAIARRDALRWRHALYTSVADAASGSSGPRAGPARCTSDRARSIEHDRVLIASTVRAGQGHPKTVPTRAVDCRP